MHTVSNVKIALLWNDTTARVKKVTAAALFLSHMCAGVVTSVSPVLRPSLLPAVPRPKLQGRPPSLLEPDEALQPPAAHHQFCEGRSEIVHQGDSGECQCPHHSGKESHGSRSADSQIVLHCIKSSKPWVMHCALVTHAHMHAYNHLYVHVACNTCIYRDLQTRNTYKHTQFCIWQRPSWSKHHTIAVYCSHSFLIRAMLNITSDTSIHHLSCTYEVDELQYPLFSQCIMLSTTVAHYV